jgi:hypothetical protein
MTELNEGLANDHAVVGRPAPRGGHRGVLFAMCLALVLVVGTVSAINLALPELAVALRASNTDLTWIADGYTVVLAALVLPFGASALCPVART